MGKDLDSLRAALQKVPHWKMPGYDGIHGYWFKNALPSITDWLSKLIDSYMKQTYPNDCQKEIPPRSKKTPKKKPPQITTDP